MDSKRLFQNQRQNLGALKLLEVELHELDQKLIDNRLLIDYTTLSISNARMHLLRRIDDYKYLQSLYDSVILILNDSERWIVKTHFIEGKTISETLALIPANMLITSRSSLIRRINKLLAKADAFIADYAGEHWVGETTYEKFKNDHSR